MVNNNRLINMFSTRLHATQINRKMSKKKKNVDKNIFEKGK